MDSTPRLAPRVRTLPASDAEGPVTRRTIVLGYGLTVETALFRSPPRAVLTATLSGGTPEELTMRAERLLDRLMAPASRQSLRAGPVAADAPKPEPARAEETPEAVTRAVSAPAPRDEVSADVRTPRPNPAESVPEAAERGIGASLAGAAETGVPGPTPLGFGTGTGPDAEMPAAQLAMSRTEPAPSRPVPPELPPPPGPDADLASAPATGSNATPTQVAAQAGRTQPATTPAGDGVPRETWQEGAKPAMAGLVGAVRLPPPVMRIAPPRGAGALPPGPAVPLRAVLAPPRAADPAPTPTIVQPPLPSPVPPPVTPAQAEPPATSLDAVVSALAAPPSASAASPASAAPPAPERAEPAAPEADGADLSGLFALLRAAPPRRAGARPGARPLPERPAPDPAPALDKPFILGKLL